MQDIQAHLRFLPLSAQKVRLVIDMVRGKNANEALELLRFVNKSAASPVRKLVASAVANAECAAIHTLLSSCVSAGLSKENLWVAKYIPLECV